MPAQTGGPNYVTFDMTPPGLSFGMLWKFFFFSKSVFLGLVGVAWLDLSKIINEHQTFRFVKLLS